MLVVHMQRLVHHPATSQQEGKNPSVLTAEIPKQACGRRKDYETFFIIHYSDSCHKYPLITNYNWMTEKMIKYQPALCLEQEAHMWAHNGQGSPNPQQLLASAVATNAEPKYRVVHFLARALLRLLLYPPKQTMKWALGHHIHTKKLMSHDALLQNATNVTPKCALNWLILQREFHVWALPSTTMERA